MMDLLENPNRYIGGQIEIIAEKEKPLRGEISRLTITDDVDNAGLAGIDIELAWLAESGKSPRMSHEYIFHRMAVLPAELIALPHGRVIHNRKAYTGSETFFLPGDQSNIDPSTVPGLLEYITETKDMMPGIRPDTDPHLWGNFMAWIALELRIKAAQAGCADKVGLWDFSCCTVHQGFLEESAELEAKAEAITGDPFSRNHQWWLAHGITTTIGGAAPQQVRWYLGSQVLYDLTEYRNDTGDEKSVLTGVPNDQVIQYLQGLGIDVDRYNILFFGTARQAIARLTDKDKYCINGGLPAHYISIHK